MNDDEVIQCEREMWRSGVWQMVRKGDVVWNVAAGDFGNEGKLISDSKFLRDLAFVYDAVGHVPPWLNAMAYSPGYWHNVVASSAPNPVVYLDLSPFLNQVQQTMALCKDSVEVASPQGRYRVQRYVYRAAVALRAQAIIGQSGDGGSGPGGIEVVHPNWEGQLVIETEGTSEHAQDLISRCTPIRNNTKFSNNRGTKLAAGLGHQTNQASLQPFRVLRERSRPGKLFIRPIFEEERVA